MSERDLIGDLRLTRERFATLVAEIRPELHRYCARMTGSIADGEDVVQDTLARAEALHAAVSRFVELAPAQRSCVILKDVLGYSLDEIASILGMTVPAVKAALHRGRSRLRELRTIEVPTARSASPEIARYAALFNARDWDAVRAMLAEDVRLDLVARVQRTGRAEVESYFTNYDKVDDWHLVALRQRVVGTRERVLDHVFPVGDRPGHPRAVAV